MRIISDDEDTEVSAGIPLEVEPRDDDSDNSLGEVRGIRKNRVRKMFDEDDDDDDGGINNESIQISLKAGSQELIESSNGEHEARTSVELAKSKQRIQTKFRRVINNNESDTPVISCSKKVIEKDCTDSDSDSVDLSVKLSRGKGNALSQDSTSDPEKPCQSQQQQSKLLSDDDTDSEQSTPLSNINSPKNESNDEELAESKSQDHFSDNDTSTLESGRECDGISNHGQQDASCVSPDPRAKVKRKLYEDSDDEENVIAALSGDEHFPNESCDNFNTKSKDNINQETKSKKRGANKGGNDLKDEKLKIYSETQRLMREKDIALPYHKPKQRSLKEFLSRRKSHLTNVTLSSSSKKMVEVWKEIEESTQNVFEFFKSDSEDEIQGKEKDAVVCQLKSEQEVNRVQKQMTEQGSNTIQVVEPECDVVEKTIEKSVENAEENVEKMQVDDSAEMQKDKSEDVNQIEGKVLKECLEVNHLQANESNAVASGILPKPRCDEQDNGKNEKSDDCDLNPKHGFSDLATYAAGNSHVHLNEIESKSQPDDKELNTQQQEKQTSLQETVTSRTQNWLNDLIRHDKEQQNIQKKEKLMEKINPKLLEITPRLSGDPDSFIDLSSEPSDLMEGAKKLMNRFFQNCIVPKKLSVKKDAELTITTSERGENGEITALSTEKVLYHYNEEIVEVPAEKPGAKLQKLRMELQSRMAAKWEDEYKKKISEAKEDFEETTAAEEEEEEEEELEDESESESEPEENDMEIVEKKRTKSKYIDSEAEESGDEAGDEMDEDEDEEKDEDNEAKDSDEDDGLECSLVPAYQPGGGLLHGGSAFTQREEDSGIPKNLLSPSLDIDRRTPPVPKQIVASSPPTIDMLTKNLQSGEFGSRRKLFSDDTSSQADIGDVFEFCSGKFSDAEQTKDSQVEVNDSQPDSGVLAQLVEKDSQDYNVDEFISGDYGTQKEISKSVDDVLGDGWKDTGITQTNTKKRILLLKDDDDDSDNEEGGLDAAPELETPATKMILSDEDETEDTVKNKLSAVSKKNKKKLQFSDDEGDENEDGSSDGDEVEDNEEGEEGNAEQAESDTNEAEAENPEGPVDYDSEENEIVKVKPSDFLENEAELSESEWSGDEDERGLDVLDAEAGDDEQLDDDKVRSQLGKIHMRRVLDDDKREVRLLQELFFEDGDLYTDGKGRDRKFKWKNIGAFDNNDNGQPDSGEESQGEDAEQEENIRKMRHERALFLMEQKKKESLISDDEEQEGDSSLLKLGMSVLEKSVKVTSDLNKINGEDNGETKRPFAMFNKRGSFLSRNEQFLSKLAKFTSGGSDNILGPKHSRNFVFAAKSPEKSEVEPAAVSATKRRNRGSNDNQTKKRKLEKGVLKIGPSLLDQLA